MPQPSEREREVLQRSFCDAYAKLGTITHAAEAVGIAASTHYGWLEQEKDGKREGYAEMFAQAEKRYCDRIEREIDRRAIEGWDEPVHYQGERVDLVRKYSDTLLIFRAKAQMPQKYRDQSSVEITGGLTIEGLDAILDAARAAKAEG